jgi:hypothetical protein
VTFTSPASSSNGDNFLSPVQSLSLPVYKAELYPTLFVGIGPTGQATLCYLKKLLCNRNHGRLPDHTRLLLVNTANNTPLKPGQAALKPQEQILISPNYQEAGKVLEMSPGEYPFLQWWVKGTNPEHTSRADGRMALYWLLYFKHELTQLNNRLTSAGQQLLIPPEYRYQVVLVASLVEASSAMIFDITQIVRRHGHVKQVLAWLSLAPLEPQANSDQDRPALMAAIRELERLNSGIEQPFDQGYLFDDKVLPPGPLIDQLQMVDCPDAPIAMSDILLALTEPNVAISFHQMLESQNFSDRPDELLFNCPASFSYFFPDQEIREVCAARLAHELLFATGEKNGSIGLLPLGSRGAMPFRAEDHRPEVRAFLRDALFQETGSPNPFGLLAEASERRWPNTPQLPISDNLHVQLQDRLLAFLNQRLRPMENQRLVRFGLLSWAQEFLTSLRLVFNDALPTLQANRAQPAARSLMAQHSALTQVVDSFNQQIVNWQNALPNVHQQLAEALNTRLASLKFFLSPNVFRAAVIAPNDEVDRELRHDPAYPYYRSFMALPAGKSTQAAFKERLRWLWDRDNNGQVRLRFAVFGVHQSEADLINAAHNCIPKDIHRLGAAILALSDALTHAIASDDTVWDYLEMRQLSDFFRPLGAPPSLMAHHSVPGKYRLNEFIFSGENQDRLGEWAVVQAQNHLYGRRTVIRDCNRLTSIKFERNFPARKAAIRLAEAKDFYHPEPSLHALPEEQVATDYERHVLKPGQPLHPRLVSMMSNAELFHTAMLCLLYGWIQECRDELQDTWYIRPARENSAPVIRLDDPTYHPSNLGEAIFCMVVVIPWSSQNDAHPLYQRSRLKGTLALLQRLLEQERQSPYEQREAIYKQAERRIEELKNSSGSFERSLGQLQEGLLKKERHC